MNVLKKRAAVTIEEIDSNGSLKEEMHNIVKFLIKCETEAVDVKKKNIGAMYINTHKKDGALPQMHKYRIVESVVIKMKNFVSNDKQPIGPISRELQNYYNDKVNVQLKLDIFLQHLIGAYKHICKQGLTAYLKSESKPSPESFLDRNKKLFGQSVYDCDLLSELLLEISDPYISEDKKHLFESNLLCLKSVFIAINGR